MTSPEWEAANEDDADRWTRYQAHTGLAPDDGLVWRDRGVIIAQLTARIGELELACQRLRDDYQGALAREAKLIGRLERQATLLAACRSMTPAEFNAQPDNRPECSPGTHSMMTWHGLPTGSRRICWDCDYQEQLP